MTLNEAREQMVCYMKKMYRLGMVNLFEGNISLRWGDHYLITPSQTDKEAMTPDMILEIDGTGRVLNPRAHAVPSSEYRMHLEAYRVRGEIMACVHNHSPWATAYAVAGQGIVTRAVPEALELFGEVPLVPYGRHGTQAISQAFAELLPDHDCVLLANHGVLTLGPDLPLAFARAEAVEKLAKTLLLTRLLGGEQPLPKEEAAALRVSGARARRKTDEGM